MRVPDVFDRLASLPGVQCPEGGGSVLRVSKPGGQVVQIEVASDVLEWHVTAYDQKGSVLWYEWMDYKGYDSTSLEELEARMCGDLAWFTETLVRADDFRARLNARLFFFAKIIPEVLIEGHWNELQMFHREERSA